MASYTKSPSEREIRCGGECGATVKIVEPPINRPILRIVGTLVQGLDLMITRDWEFDGKARAWFCRPCRTRRRLLKVLH